MFALKVSGWKKCEKPGKQFQFFFYLARFTSSLKHISVASESGAVGMNPKGEETSLLMRFQKLPTLCVDCFF